MPAWALGGSAALWSAIAHAASTTAQGDSSLIAVVMIVLGIAAAYLLTHFVLESIQRRLLFKSGAEYILLGVLAGPLVLGVGVFDDLTPIAPLIALAAGWVGLVSGMDLDLRKLLQIRDGTMRLSILESMGAGLAVTFAAQAFFSSGLAGDLPPERAWLAAGAMGAASAAGSSSAVDLLSRHYRLEGGMAGLLHRAACMSDILAVLVFGLLFCVFHEAPTHTSRPVSPTEWAVISVGVGVVLGAAFTLMLGDDESENSRFLALVGIIAFASGASWFLHLSSLFISLMLGVVLVNTARQGEAVRQTLTRVKGPMTLILLVAAGALWQPPDDLLVALLAAAGTLAFRFLGKAIGGFLGTIGTHIRRDVARGLLAQGDIAVAMAISFRLVYDGPAVDIAYTAILVSVVVSEIVAPRFLKGLLIDAGQIRHEVSAHPTAEEL